MRKRSIMLLIATLLSTAYTIYLFCYFIGNTANATDGAEIIGSAIATALVTPHAAIFLVGAVFGWLGYAMKQSWAALVAAILYSVGGFLFILYAMFSIPILVMGFIGYVNQKKLICLHKPTAQEN